jgi:hypothetical protein
MEQNEAEQFENHMGQGLGVLLADDDFGRQVAPFVFTAQGKSMFVGHPMRAPTPARNDAKNP